MRGVCSPPRATCEHRATRRTAFRTSIAASRAAAHPCANPSTPKGGAFLSTVKRVRECGPTCRITQACSKLRATELKIWREEVARVAPEQKDRDTFGRAGAPCLVSRSDVFPSLMQGCHRGSDPETGGSGSHGAVHSTPPGRSKQVQKSRKEASRGQASSEAVRLAIKTSVYQTHLPPAS